MDEELTFQSEWRKIANLPVGIRKPQVLCLNNELVVGGGYINGSLDEQSKLFTYRPQSIEPGWFVTDTPTYWSAIASYQSKIVLVGGYDAAHVQTNLLYTFSDGKFLQFIRPMQVKRSSASAVSSLCNQTREIIIVAGGWGEYGPLTSVEVYNEDNWTITYPIPEVIQRLRCFVDNGYLYILGGTSRQTFVYSTSMKNLLETSMKAFQLLVQFSYDCSSVAVISNHILSVGSSHSRKPTSSVRAYCLESNEWLKGVDLPIALSNSSVARVDLSMDLLLVGGELTNNHHNLEIFKTTFQIPGATSSLQNEKFLKEATIGNLTLEEDFQTLKTSVAEDHSPHFDLPGVEVIGRTSVLVTNSVQSFHWAGYGFKLHIPQDSLPAGVDQCHLDIVASVSGQYQFAENEELVSAVYWVRPHPPCRFQQQLTVELQHCARVTTSTKLTFVRAVCSQRSQPYNFKKLEGNGSFTQYSTYGSLQLGQFSGICITADCPVERFYTAGLFYLTKTPLIREIHFVITWDEEPHVTVVKQYYSQMGAAEGPYLSVEYEKEKISLDLPLPPEGLVLQEWQIVPLVQPSISRKQVDNFQPGRRIPCCQLRAKCTSQTDDVPELLHCVTLIGTKEQNVFITIQLDQCYSEKGGKIVGGGSLTFHQLQAELSSIVEWYRLGISLGIPPHFLQKIKADNHSTDEQRLAMIDLITKNYRFTWEEICKALQSIEEVNLALTIKQKYLK